MSHDYPSDAAIDASQFRTWQTLVDTTDSVDVSLRGYLIAKRVLDLAIALLILLILSPLLLFVAFLVKIWDRGPVFFTQVRVGKGGEEFACYKFRSMVPTPRNSRPSCWSQNHHADNRTFKIPA